MDPTLNAFYQDALKKELFTCPYIIQFNVNYFEDLQLF